MAETIVSSIPLVLGAIVSTLRPFSLWSWWSLVDFNMRVLLSNRLVQVRFVLLGVRIVAVETSSRLMILLVLNPV